MRTVVQLVTAWMFCFGVAQTAIAQRQEQADFKLHVLIVADTLDAKVGKSAKADIGWIDSILRANVPQASYKLKILEGKAVTPDQILAEIRAIPARPSDGLLFHYSGHGGYNRRKGEHFFLVGNRNLSRKTIKDALRAKGTQLQVVISDTCSEIQKQDAQEPAEAEAVPAPLVEAKVVSPLFHSLFSDVRGLVDINSSRPGQDAKGTTYGGVFTFAMCQNLSNDVRKPASWSEILQRINNDVRPTGLTQTAYAVSPLPSANRLGVTVTATDRAWLPKAKAGARLPQGVAVTSVVPKSAATRIRSLTERATPLTLAAQRDVITKVNGAAVENEAEFYRAVKDSPKLLKITVYDAVTEKTGQYTADLTNRPVKKIDLPKPRNNEPLPLRKIPLPRLGVIVSRSDRFRGVEIVSVVRNSPATAIQDAQGRVFRLVAKRDIITHANGLPVRTGLDIRKTFPATPTAITLRVYDLQTQSHKTYKAFLK